MRLTGNSNPCLQCLQSPGLHRLNVSISNDEDDWGLLSYEVFGALAIAVVVVLGYHCRLGNPNIEHTRAPDWACDCPAWKNSRSAPSPSRKFGFYVGARVVVVLWWLLQYLVVMSE